MSRVPWVKTTGDFADRPPAAADLVKFVVVNVAVVANLKLHKNPFFPAEKAMKCVIPGVNVKGSSPRFS